MPLDIVDRSTGAGLDETREASEGSEGLALDTGGLVLENRNDLARRASPASPARRAATTSSATLPPNRAADGSFRKIEVKVAREGVIVRARRGYFAPGPDDKGGKRRGARHRDAAGARRAVRPDRRFRCAPSPRCSARPSRARPRSCSPRRPTSAASRSPSATAPPATPWSSCCSWRAATPASSRASTSSSRWPSRKETRARFERDWFPITRELRSLPAPTRRRSSPATGTTGGVGSLTHDFEVPAPAGLRVSSLVLSDRLPRGGEGHAGPELVARRVASRRPGRSTAASRSTARRATRRAASPGVTAGLRRPPQRTGACSSAAPETPLRPGSDGSLTRSLGVPLDGAAAREPTR